jgi:CubicO group peptidase (beta-lactamase class C family)
MDCITRFKTIAVETNRRKFIKTSGTAALGMGFLPAIARTGMIFSHDHDPDTGAGFGFSSVLPRATPESQGISSKGISDFITAANASGYSWHSFMLLRHGKVVAEGWWKPFEPEFKHSLYSLSKSFTSTAIGLLVKEGKLNIDTPVLSFFPDDSPAAPDDNLKQMTIKHLLTMNTGHEEDSLPKMRSSDQVWVRTFLGQPVKFQPGSHFLYDTGATYMLGAIVFKVTGETLEKYLTPRLFLPLDIRGYDWETSPQGLNTAGYGLRVKTEDIAKFGQLYLQKGRWNNQEILPETWVNAATSYQTKSQEGNADWSQGYGYLFWRCKPGFYRGDGAYGQYCIVMPDHDAVLAVTGESPDMQNSLNIIWDHLLPAIGSSVLPENLADQTTLNKDLKGLVLPVVKGAADSYLSYKYHGKKIDLEKNDFGATQMQLKFSKDSCEWIIKTAEKKPVSIRFGWENWLVNKDDQKYAFPEAALLPVPSKLAGTATWTNSNTLQLNARFVDTIHGDKITCVFDGNKVSVSFMNSIAEMSKTTIEKRAPLTGTLQADTY